MKFKQKNGKDMRKMLLMSSKGKNKYRMLFLLLGIVFLVVSIIFAVTMSPSPWASDQEETMYMVVVAISAGFGIFAIMFALVRCGGYINIYDDRVEGKGLQGKGMQSFCLQKSQIKSSTQESYYLCVHTDIGTYKIICDKKSRNEIMRLLSQRGNSQLL